MDNAATKLAPVEHRVAWMGKDPTTKESWRIKCQCGWTEKCYPSVHRTDQEHNEQATKVTLMLRWERHVYTPEERRILTELGG